MVFLVHLKRLILLTHLTTLLGLVEVLDDFHFQNQAKKHHHLTTSPHFNKDTFALLLVLLYQLSFEDNPLSCLFLVARIVPLKRLGIERSS